jgi:hypothetical protein
MLLGLLPIGNKDLINSVRFRSPHYYFWQSISIIYIKSGFGEDGEEFVLFSCKDVDRLQRVLQCI